MYLTPQRVMDVSVKQYTWDVFEIGNSDPWSQNNRTDSGMAVLLKTSMSQSPRNRLEIGQRFWGKYDVPYTRRLPPKPVSVEGPPL